MKRTFTVGKDKGTLAWFDSQFKMKRRLVRQSLRKYHRSNGTDARDQGIAYTEQRQQHKRSLKETKSEDKNQISKIREDSGKDHRKFWSKVNSVTSRGSMHNENCYF